MEELQAIKIIASMETVKLRRSARKGRLTRITHKLADLEAGDWTELRTITLDQLKEDLAKESKLFNALQTRLEQLMEEDEDTTEEVLAREINQGIELGEVHTDLMLRARTIKKTLTLCLEATALEDEVQLIKESYDPSEGEFEKDASKLRHRINSFLHDSSSSASPVVEDFRRNCKDHLTDLATRLSQGRAKRRERKERAELKTPHLERPTSYKGTKLKLDLPTFSGHPLDWHHFCELFTAALDRAGDDYSERERACFLLKAMQGSEAEQIVKSHATSEKGYTNALKALRGRYGSAKKVFPHLVGKMMTQEKIRFSQDGFAKLRRNYTLPLQSMKELGCTDATQIAAALALSQFDDSLRDEWTKFYKTSNEVPTLEEIETFVEPLESNMQALTPVLRNEPTSLPPRKTTPRYTKGSSTECPLCKEQHRLYKCPVFLGYDVDRRFKTVKDKRGCTNCLAINHSTQDCTSTYTCRECDAKHNTLLHRPTKQTSSKTFNAGSTANKSAIDLMTVGEDDYMTTSTSQEPPKISFLHTAIAKAIHEDREVDVRMALDTGASASLVTETVATQLKLRRHPRRLNIKGACGGGVSRHFVELTLKSILQPDKFMTTKLQVVKSLPEVPAPRNIKQIKAEPHLQGLPLADPHFGGKLDILLGGVDYTKCLVGSLTTGLDSEVAAQPTLFGWTVTGPLEYQPKNSSVLQIQTSEDTLKDDLSRLWELDRTPESAHLSLDDEEVTQHFLDTHRRDEDGRYVVRLPRLSPTPSLGTSRNVAVRRSNQNEKTLQKKGKLTEFQAALEEYYHLGHAEEVPDSDRTSPHYYMPVHGVFKASSTTTKVRPVFDASASTSNGVSLNDTLKQGPNLYPHLSDILLRFRKHTIGFSADISKMFREVKLHPDERDAHRFLLRDKNGQLKDLRMKRLTFGVRSSPYLATQVIRHLAEQHSSSHPQASNAVLNHFYVDDYLAGAETVQEANLLREQLCNLLQLAGMNLRKWRSCCNDFRSSIPPDILETADLHITSAEKPLKALGLHWNVAEDCLSVSTPTVQTDVEFTKRSIASNLGKVYDLLGFYAPYTVTGKILLRRLWELKIGWDEPVPPEIQESWLAWTSQLDLISKHTIPRRYSTSSTTAVSHHLHGFADASQEAYGAVVYLRQTFPDKSSTTSIVISKARVLPLKELTIPRAELTAVLIVAKLLQYCSRLLEIENMTAWTDSSIVLCWLRKAPASLNTFVGNRIKQIQSLIPNARWSHISSSSNPADMLSRGMTAEALLDASLWWKGPPWLNLPQEEWPSPQFALPENLPEIKTVTLVAAPETQEKPWQNFSSFDHMVRILSWCRRYLHNSRHPSDQRIMTSTLSTTEYQGTINKLIAMDQQEFYPQAIQAVKGSKQLPKNHVLKKYILSLNDKGVLLVSTRVRDPHNPSQDKKIIPLSIHSNLTRLLLSSLHLRHLHPGTNTLLAIVKDTYHIPGIRNYLKGLSRRCTKCQRAYQHGTNQPMGLLPQVRTTPASPFLHTGVDFAGPFITKQGYTRKPVRVKSYACLFVCMATRAVHLELCLSLSTDEFLAAMRRFCSRRGCPASMYSDNGSNFIGAYAELLQIQELLQRSKTSLSHFTAQNGITWHFSPPRTPHAGGLWEAAVKQMKLLLRKLVQPHQLRTEELSSILIEIEGILNSRPLVQIDSTDPDNLALTPGHFLVGRPIKALPTDISSKIKLSSLRRWQLTQRLSNDLWSAWKEQYLHTLQTRQKWTSTQHVFRKDDVVLLKEDSLGYRHWPLARITNLFPGDDGVVRVVELLCGGKIYKRSTHLIIPLLNEESSKPA